MTADKSTVFKNNFLNNQFRKLIPIGVLLFFLQVPALKDIYKYLPYPFICSVVIFLLSGFTYYILLFTEIAKPILRSKFFSIALLLLLVFAGLIIYPYANARGSFGAGSTADDAIIEVVNNLLHGKGLYDVDIGIPVSPGPGWVLVNIPFAFRFSIFLMTPAYLIILLLLLRKFFGESYSVFNRIMVAFMSSMLFWDLTVTGYDHFSIGIAFLIFIVVINKIKPMKKNIFIAALLCGIVSTARVVFFPFGLLVGALLFRRDKQAGIVFACLSTGIALLIHALFYFTSDYYQPMHLFSKGSGQSGLLPLIIATIAMLIIGIPLLLKKTSSLHNWLLTTLVWMGIPLSVVAWGGLSTYMYQLELWEGAHYLFLLAPLASMGIFCRFSCKTDN